MTSSKRPREVLMARRATARLHIDPEDRGGALLTSTSNLRHLGRGREHPACQPSRVGSIRLEMQPLSCSLASRVAASWVAYVSLRTRPCRTALDGCADIQRSGEDQENGNFLQTLSESRAWESGSFAVLGRGSRSPEHM